MPLLSVKLSLSAVLLAFCAVSVSNAASPDLRPGPKLLSLVPNEAQIVAGMSAPLDNDQPNSFLIITHNNVVDLNDFFSLSGADSSRAIHQIIFVATADRHGDISGNLEEHSLLVDGHFDQARVFRSAVNGGSAVDSYRGIPVLVVKPLARERGVPGQTRWLAILSSDLDVNPKSKSESTIAIFGTIASIQQELDRHLAGSTVDPTLLARLARLRREDETWCLVASTAGSEEIGDALKALNPRLADLVQNGGGLQFGIHFGNRLASHVEFEYEVTPPSPADTGAASHSPVQFLSQSLAAPDPESSPFTANFNTTAAGSPMRELVKLSKDRYEAWMKDVAGRRLRLLEISRRQQFAKDIPQ